ncbi:MAG: HAD-IIIA family hydrolase [Thermoleophilaceae bacterium]|nr:HAD-IIIA family hydrolase [Thermoleophilaceae bacterium]
MSVSYDVVIPSTGRESLGRLLRALRTGYGPLPERVLVVDDRPDAERPLTVPEGVEVVRGPARGPAAARNVGWRAASAEWVAFLDDDVVPPSGWRDALAGDLSRPPEAAASQGRIVVPLPRHRRPTDWERNVAGLERARWATADMAFRRCALAAVGGFDERFRHAYREDSDLGLRLTNAGFRVERGRRHVLHPVGPADPWTSLRLQAGNVDDVLMRALHGPRWRERAGAPRGRLRRHLATTAAGLSGLAALAARRPTPAAVGLGLWAVGTAELACARIAPGPRATREVALMLWTSALMPPVAALQWGLGHARRRRLLADAARAPRAERAAARPLAVLLDRDGTLIEDVPYNGDPRRVRPVPGARRAVERLRHAGVKLAVVSNQSGIGRGLIDERQVAAVNARVDELLGPLGPWLVCPHPPDAGCDCRKPGPGLVLRAAERLGVAPEHCAVIGDIGADVEAAMAAGARPVLVPTPRTRREEIAAAPEVAGSLAEAVDRLLDTGDARTEALAA